MANATTLRVVKGVEDVRRCRVCKSREAAACDECRRALATFPESRHVQPMELLPDGRYVPTPPAWTKTWAFDCITRHPDKGTDCLICASGPASLCAICLLEGALAHRRQVVGVNA